MDNEKTPDIENEAVAEDAASQTAAQPIDREQNRRIVYRETGIVLIGEIICLGIMMMICALMGWLDRAVVLGGVIGTLIAGANFFFMAVSASLAADKAQNQDVKGGMALVKSSSTIRLIAMFVILFACVKSGLCNVLAVILPMVFVRPIITVAEFFRKSGEA